MSPTVLLLLEIMQIAAASVGAASKGETADEAALSGSILTIIQKGVAAYEAQEGKPIDPSLIKPYEEIP